MAQPEKVTFYGDPTLEQGYTDPVTGEGTVMPFRDGKYETSDPMMIAFLERLADTPSHPVSRKPLSTSSSEKKA